MIDSSRSSESNNPVESLQISENKVMNMSWNAEQRSKEFKYE